MVVFNTMIPLEKTKSISDLMGICKEWLINSPHYCIKERLAGSEMFDGLNIHCGNENLEVIMHNNAQAEFGGIRFIKVENDIVWQTDIIAYKYNTVFMASVNTSADTRSFSIKLPKAKKPHIVKLIIEKLGAASDDFIETSKDLHNSTLENIDDVAKIMNGISQNIMPVVYVSATRYGNYYVDLKNISYWLSGIAHVYIEKSIHISFALKDKTNGRNVYNGAVGIYWPNSYERYIFFPKIGESIDKFTAFIIDEVRSAWINIRPFEKCRWTTIKEMKIAAKLKAMQEEGNKEISDYICTFDQELAAIEEANKKSEQENARLRNENDYLRNEIRLNAHNSLLAQGEEQDLYLYEQNDILIEIIEKELANTPARTRKHDVLKSLLEKNNTHGKKKEILSELKSTLESYVCLDHKTRGSLERIGFKIFEDGKHYKLIFHNDERYPYALAKTPSDHRSGLNSFSDIRKLLFS